MAVMLHALQAAFPITVAATVLVGALIFLGALRRPISMLSVKLLNPCLTRMSMKSQKKLALQID